MKTLLNILAVVVLLTGMAVSTQAFADSGDDGIVMGFTGSDSDPG